MMENNKFKPAANSPFVAPPEQPLTIVVATGTAVSVRHGGGELAKRIERAMADAVARAFAEGLDDPDLIRARILKARSDLIASEG